MVKHDCLYGPNCIIRKNGWKKIKNEICLNDKLVHEDLDLAIHIAPFGKIKFDPTLIVSTSFRRWKKPDAYIEYLYRGLKSINNHPQFSVGQRSKRLIKQFVTRALLIDEK